MGYGIHMITDIRFACLHFRPIKKESDGSISNPDLVFDTLVAMYPCERLQLCKMM